MKKIAFKEIKPVIDIIAKKYKPERIFLFGSFAWGKPDKDSDVDLLIIKESRKRKLDRIYDVYRILKERKIPIDVIVFTPKEFRERLNLGDFFVKEILGKGKLVYEKK